MAIMLAHGESLVWLECNGKWRGTTGASRAQLQGALCARLSPTEEASIESHGIKLPLGNGRVNRRPPRELLDSPRVRSVEVGTEEHRAERCA